ncbi:MAG: DUF1905 domain-containing protein [Phycisphaerales bacterium]|nr:DUF1905 domain-containing protein [Phycisphaerales bacterium]
MTRISFVAKPWYALADQGKWTFITLPVAVHKKLGGLRARFPIVVHFGAAKFRTSAMPYDGRHHFMFNAILDAKRPETRARRIAQCITMVRAGTKRS